MTRRAGLFSAVVCGAAALLFVAELMVGKAALPRFGGSPAVWTTSLFFFQATLLGGYACAFWLAQQPSAKTARRWALAVCGALLMAQVGLLSARATLVPDGVGVTAVLVFLGCTSGPVLLLLSMTAPLAQGWYARSHEGAPWWLYAVSNAGSVAGLVAYPFIIEPSLGLKAQTLGFVTVGLVWLVLAALASRRLTDDWRLFDALEATAPSVGAQAWWLALSACGSALLSAVSSTLTQDVASTPLLWALPLGLYLLTFVVAFRGGRWSQPARFVALWVVTLGYVSVDRRLEPSPPLVFTTLAYCGLLVAGCMLCHGALYRARPSPAHGPRYYLFIALGGALGSALMGVVSPLVFDDLTEVPVLVAVMTLGLCAVVARNVPLQSAPTRVFSVAAIASALAMLVAYLAADDAFLAKRVFSERDLLGVVRVLHRGDAGTLDEAVELTHGHIVHGLQWLHPSSKSEPSLYYAADSGYAQALALVRDRGPLRAKVLGLGCGVTAATFGPGDEVDYYELSEPIIRLARGEGGHFSFLADTQAQTRVHLGDARALLQAEAQSGAAPVDLLMVDVFSGDAIPAHLLTAEAFALYRSLLKVDGLLLMHLTNRHVTLAPVAAGAALAEGMTVRRIVTPHRPEHPPSEWFLASMNATVLEPLRAEGVKQILGPPERLARWTDDDYSVLPFLGSRDRR